MTTPVLSVSQTAISAVTADVLVFGVVKAADGPQVAGAEGLDPATIAQLGNLTSFGVTGARDELTRIPAIPGSRAASIALVGLGTVEPGVNDLRYAAGVVGRRLTGVSSVAIALPVPSIAHATAVLEGAILGAYDYLDYRSTASLPKTRPLESIILLTSQSVPDETIAAAAELGRAVHLVRDLVNMPPLDLYPSSFADRAVALGADADVTVTVWDETDLAADGFGGILGVGQGSSRPPRLVKVTYSPTNAPRHIALVGKGITFDTGGLSLKPAGSMIGMKYDMTGAATALAVVLAAARLKLPVALTAWLCLAENMPSSTAIRPNDVLTIRGGRTVEVLNTDAEGRLVLADGLVAASEEHPDAIIDIATLTGAAIVALGHRYVGTMGDGELVSEILAAGTLQGEPFWHMPLPREMRPMLNSDVADLANIKQGNTAGGMLIAGVFLKEFVGQKADGSGPIPWAHLDIAGAAHNTEGGYGYTPKGPTGVTVRTLLALAAGSTGPAN
jgi:leucyl aminopeptidase